MPSLTRRVVWAFAILSIGCAAAVDETGTSGEAVDTKAYWPFDGSLYPQEEVAGKADDAADKAKHFGGLGDHHPCSAGERTWDDSWGTNHPCPPVPCAHGQTTWTGPLGNTWPCPPDWLGSVGFRRLTSKKSVAGDEAVDKDQKSAAVQALEDRSAGQRPAFLRGGI